MTVRPYLLIRPAHISDVFRSPAAYVTGTGSLLNSLFIISTQAMRPILLTSSTATSILGLRVSVKASLDSGGAP